MSESQDRQYFIVKHGRDAFTALPGYIWRTGLSEREVPRGFRQVHSGDRWIEFAYIVDEEHEERCSLVMGFHECVKEMWFGRIPVEKMPEGTDGWDEKAWMIEGRAFGKQPRCPVTVPSINDLLWKFRKKKVVGRTALIRVSAREFNHVRSEAFRLELDPRKIPMLEREPLCEQEVLSIVVAGYRRALGIEEILRVQTHFPDMLVKIDGKQVWLELEMYGSGFWQHWDDLRLLPGVRNRRVAKRREDPDDNRPVACLCWVDNDREHELKKSVRGLRVFELQSLLRTGQRITF
jgi:hypothetical protein